MSRTRKLKDINSYVIETIRKTVKVMSNTPEDEVLNRGIKSYEIMELRFRERTVHAESLKAYLFSTKASWYWSVIALACASILSIFAIPEDAFPTVYLRYALGSIFVIFLPGYSLVKALFPRRELDIIEEFVLSLGTSLAMIPAVGFLLNQAPWGIRTISFTVAMSILIVILANIALFRERETQSVRTSL